MYLIIIAAKIIIPLAYYLIGTWTENFAHRAPLDYKLFVVVAVMAMVFGFLTVAFHSLKTARTNPVDSLKYE
jgi:putative ABC transport system permease protein